MEYTVNCRITARRSRPPSAAAERERQVAVKEYKMDHSEPRRDVKQTRRATANRSAIVTGGASGIGRALGEELAAAGVHVVLADRQVEPAEQVASGIRERGGAAIATELDVRDADRFREVVQIAVAQTGRLDYLFNNAEIMVAGPVVPRPSVAVVIGEVRGEHSAPSAARA